MVVNRNAQIGLVKGTYTDEGLDSFWELLEGKVSKETTFPQWGAAIQVWSRGVSTQTSLRYLWTQGCKKGTDR